MTIIFFFFEHLRNLDGENMMFNLHLGFLKTLRVHYNFLKQMWSTRELLAVVDLLDLHKWVYMFHISVEVLHERATP
jgi:hypothetical protein